MLSLLLITALAVQTPQTSKPTTTDSTAQRRSTQSAQRGSSPSAIGRQAFHDRMRELWTDHAVYTRSLIVSTVAGLPDSAEVSQRLMRTQDELGEAIKPYYGDASGSQLASLLRNQVQLAAKTVTAAKGPTTTAPAPSSAPYITSTDTVRVDTSQSRMKSQYPTNPSAENRRNQADSTKRNPNTPITSDSMNQRTSDSTQKNVEGQQYGMTQQTGRVDSTALNQAIAELKANGDSIAAFLAKANPRGFSRQMLSSAIQMHITLLLKEATAQVKKDWSGSISAFDESRQQALQFADMLSDGIMKQFPSRFNNKATTVSSR